MNTLDDQRAIAEAAREEAIFAMLCRKYVQRADEHQKSMGLQYTQAETRDLARTFTRFEADRIAALEAEHAAIAPARPDSALADELAAVVTFGGELGTALIPPKMSARILAALRQPAPRADSALREAEEARVVELEEALGRLLDRSDAVRVLAEEQASKMPSRMIWTDDVRTFQMAQAIARAALASEEPTADKGD